MPSSCSFSHSGRGTYVWRSRQTSKSVLTAESGDDFAPVFGGNAVKKLALISPGLEHPAACLVNFASMSGQEYYWTVLLDALAGPAESRQFRAFDVHFYDGGRRDFILEQ